MRLFIAIDLPSKLKEKIVTSIQPLTNTFPQVAWTRKENFHLTVKFLGEVKKIMKSEEAVTDIKEAISRSCSRVKPFTSAFTTLGYFQKEQLIIWLGVQAKVEMLSLTKQIEKEMAKLGFPKEKRIYSPHITLGRGKHLSPSLTLRIRNVVNKTPFNASLPFPVERLTLMQSTLTNKGPIYTPLAHFPLLSK